MRPSIREVMDMETRRARLQVQDPRFVHTTGSTSGLAPIQEDP